MSRSRNGRQLRTKRIRLPDRNLEIGTWNICSLNGKERELVEEAKRYKLDIVGLSSTKRRDSGIDDLNGWKLFYSGCDPTSHAMAGVGILTSTRLAEKIIDWIPVSMRIGILKLRIDNKILNFVQVYAPNRESEYESFLEELECSLESIPNSESLILLGDFNAHVGSDSETWKGVIGMNGEDSLNSNGSSLLHFCASNGLSIMNSYFRHKSVHKYTWYRDTLGQKSIIDFMIVSSDLKSSVMDVRVKRGAELSTDHHLVIGTLGFFCIST